MVAATNIGSERFNEGLTIGEYIYGMQKNKETFRENYDNFSPRAEDIAALREISDLNVLVLLEDWCGDVLRYVPALRSLLKPCRRGMCASFTGTLTLTSRTSGSKMASTGRYLWWCSLTRT